MSGGTPTAPTDISGKAGIVLTNKGDVATFDTARTRLAIGSNDQVLTADSAQAKGVKWATASGGGQMELLNTHEASGNEDTYTFTPSSDLQDEDYSAIKIFFIGETNGQDHVKLTWNGYTNEFQNTVFYWDNTTRNSTNYANANGMYVINNWVNNLARQVWFEATLMMSDISGFKSFAYAKGYSYTQRVNDVACYQTSNNDRFTSFKVFMDSSSWGAGTKIDFYGIKRT